MRPRLLCCAFVVACLLGCSRGSTPTSTESPVNSSPSMAGQAAEVHTTVVLRSRADHGLDGTINETFVATTSYDRRGNALTVVEESDNAGRTSRKVTTSSYNKWGNMLEQAVEVDRPGAAGDGWYWITTVETDRWDRPSRQVYLDDWDRDGEPDHEGNTLSYPAFDHQGRPLQEVLASDSDGDGALDSRETNTVSYDHRGNIEEQTHEFDRLTDGSVELGIHSVSTYNGYGEVVRSTTEGYEPGDGTWRATLVTTAFDDRGNPVTRVTEYDYAPSDGIIDSRYFLMTSFDDRHRPVTEIEDSDFSANGTVDSRRTTTYEYFGTLTPRSNSITREISSKAHSNNLSSSGTDAGASGARLPKVGR